DYMVFESELVGIILAIDIIRASNLRTSKACILLDNQAAIQATEGDSATLGRYLVEEIRKKLRALMKEKGNRFRLTIQWVPGHVGVDGNEKVDALAKWAAGGESTPLSDQKSRLSLPLPSSCAAIVAA
ncbi:hypothetical protein BT96DRAFT_759685, partial [Gymnopus androsaceus JB14]